MVRGRMDEKYASMDMKVRCPTVSGTLLRSSRKGDLLIPLIKDRGHTRQQIDSDYSAMSGEHVFIRLQ